LNRKDNHERPLNYFVFEVFCYLFNFMLCLWFALQHFWNSENNSLRRKNITSQTFECFIFFIIIGVWTSAECHAKKYFFQEIFLYINITIFQEILSPKYW